MAVKILMPTFGMTEGEAVITKWLRGVGDAVQADEPLLEAETDKATLDVPAPAAGVLLRIEVDAGRPVSFRTVLGWIGQASELQAPFDGEGPVAGRTEAASRSEVAAASPATADDEWVKASPLARRIAREHGLDLRKIQGRGSGGRVLEADVRHALAAADVEPPAAAGSGLAPGSSRVPTPGEAIQDGPAQLVAPVPPPEESLTTVRRLTAERMTESFRSAPHFYLQVEIRAASLVRVRKELLPEVDRQAGVKLTYTDLFARALALLLPRHPLLNAGWHESSVRTFSEVHLGVATTTPQGLLVPVIHGAESLSLLEIARRRDLLVRQAKEGRLAAADLSGGTMTLTNLGMYGVDAFLPILNPPQSAILAAGAIAERPVAVAGLVVAQPTVNLTLAVDHRVADGAQAAEFLRDLRELLEAPARMLI